MVRDRFAEFQQRAQASTSEGSVVVDVGHLPYGTLTTLQQMDEMRESINRLEDRIRVLNLKQTGVLSQTVVDSHSKDELESIIRDIQDHIRSLRPRIHSIDQSIRLEERTTNQTGVELRIRRNQCEQLKRRLHEVLTTFSETQSEYKRRVSQRVKRQLNMAGENLSTDAIDRMIASNSEQIFYKEINPLTTTARLALEDATNRHTEILELERSISELNELFVEVYELVSIQDNLVNNIAKNVESAAEYTVEARDQISRAVTYKQKAQRKTCILVTIAFAVLIALIILVLVLVLAK